MRTLPALFSLCLIVCPCIAQTAQQSAPPVTLHARANLVIVDVVVTDGHNHPVHGLKREQFTLLENHSAQHLKAFEEHIAPSSADLAKLPPVPQLPPGVFTNYTPAPADGSPLNILLLDALNTPLSDQQYVRQQLLDFVKHEKPGTRIAIFGLSSQLVLLQAFTADPNLLRQVITRQGGKGSILLDNVAGGEGISNSAADQLAADSPTSPNATLSNSNAAPIEDVASNLKTFEDMNQTFQTSLRVRYTLDALNQLARYVANLPGRKNLIWFSGSFPINILPSADGASDPFAATLNLEPQYRETTNLLSRSQVAVYPVDARGLQASPVYSASVAPGRYTSNPSSFNRDSVKFIESQNDEHSTMLTMARDTGGEAFINTNGLSEAVTKAIDDGSNFYSLAYTPTDARYIGDFRHIDIKLNGLTYNLTYRRGYYADDPSAPSKEVPLRPNPDNPAAASIPPAELLGESLMQKAMQHGVPGATEIVYTVRVLPDAPGPDDTLAPNNVANRENFLPIKPPYRRFRVDFGTDPSNIVFTTTPDGVYHGTVEFVTFLYEPNGRVANSVSNKIVLALTPARYAGMMHQGGIAFRQEISAPVTGDFSIRTAVRDLASNHIGSSEFPLALVKNLPPLPASPQPPR